jgi:glycosyltransferase involved in cell wall biosynthesis/capsular polysaccharide biosynthesis protein
MMNPPPLISVVMICYNHEKYIDEAVRSILSQTYTDFELIIVDDGSTDDTFEIIQGYDDPRIIALTQENSGPSIALNTGIMKSAGEYIAIMSGDDLSLPQRLEVQLRQIEEENADMVFSLPEIIGENSEVLGQEARSGFFGREFDSTPDLYKSLFYSGNFLCAPSCFCRQSTIKKVGRFRRGLIQLQDFDYWIRACKKNLVIKLYEKPVIQYRSSQGSLTKPSNISRSNMEATEIYRSFLDDVSVEFLREVFGKKISPNTHDDSLDLEIDKSLLYLNNPMSRPIGVERIINQFEDDRAYDILKNERSFGTTDFFEHIKFLASGGVEVINTTSKFNRVVLFIRNTLKSYLQFVIAYTDVPIWTAEEIKERIQYYLEKGDDKRALMVLHGYRKFPPGPTIFTKIAKVFRKIFRKINLTLLEKARALINNIRNTEYKTHNAEVLSNLIEDVFTLRRMYDYSKKTSSIVYEAPLEQMYMKKPQVIGSISRNLSEGNIVLPKAYISVLNNVTIFGGSNLVVSQDDELLSDDMVDFHTEDFGVKSLQVISLRSKSKAILRYKKDLNKPIKKGILISCEHDPNYFHWLVEVLPKILFIDQQKDFIDVPLLIPKELHENLIIALERVNINNHRLIPLEHGIAYQVDRLIFPSALSRVIDRYKGAAVFDEDIILSKKWVSQVASLLKNNTQYNENTWRKIYLTREKGMRALGNKEEIEEVFTKRDFEIIDLNGWSLDEQIELFSETSVVVAPTGAALTNMLFCQPGTKIILFMSNHEVSNYYFWHNLGIIMELDLKIIVGKRLFNLTNYWSVHDDYVIDANLVLEEIDNHEK